MATINKVMVGELLVGEGNEVAHIDLIIGPRGSAAESAFCNSLTNNKDGFTTLLAVVAPNLPCKPNTVMFNKVTIKGAKQAVQMFGPAQTAVARAVADSVEKGVIPAAEADDLFICVGVFIHWEAEDDAKIRDYNYQATMEFDRARHQGHADGSGSRLEEGFRGASVRRFLDKKPSRGRQQAGDACRPSPAIGRQIRLPVGSGVSPENQPDTFLSKGAFGPLSVGSA